MAEPIVYISHFRVKEGKLKDLRRLFREAAKSLEAEKPRTVVFLAYLNEDGTEATFVHVFPDAESMDVHVQGAEERTRVAYKLVQPEGFELYWAPNEGVLEMMRQEAGSEGVALILQSEHLGGFLRLRWE
jgi:quinol monooxygenase YgiN